MNINQPRPYLIVPKLIAQPTWGGEYILKLKNWERFQSLLGKKIGQSYELYRDSKLAIDVYDSSDPNFGPENYNIGFTTKNVLDFYQNKDRPLLIKLNQALGNSFQLHIKPKTIDPFWKAKPESWYFLEKGSISLGVKPDIDISEYKKTCQKAANYMDGLSADILSGAINLNQAKEMAKDFIFKNDPHRFVQVKELEKHSAVDLSAGAIHHSWEENESEYPNGNIIYEVQLDAMDDVATIRAFDQGKIKEDGTVRKMNIDDYFKHLDTVRGHNLTENLVSKKETGTIIKSGFYQMDVVEVDNESENTNGGFPTHLYVRDGKVEITSGGIKVIAGVGHSCFIPPKVDKYSLKPLSDNSVVLKTFQPEI